MVIFISIFFIIPRITENPTIGIERLGFMVICGRVITIMATAYFLVDLLTGIFILKKKILFPVTVLIVLSVILYFLYN
jgi:hypothetical protein